MHKANAIAQQAFLELRAALAYKKAVRKTHGTARQMRMANDYVYTKYKQYEHAMQQAYNATHCI